MSSVNYISTQKSISGYRAEIVEVVETSTFCKEPTIRCSSAQRNCCSAENCEYLKREDEGFWVVIIYLDRKSLQKLSDQVMKSNGLV